MAKKTILKRMAKLLPKSDALNTVLKMDDETNYREPVNVTPSEPKMPLDKEATGDIRDEISRACTSICCKASDSSLLNL